MVRSNRRVAIAEISEQMRILIGSTHTPSSEIVCSIVNCAHAGFRDHWYQHKNARNMASLDFLLHYSVEGNDFLCHIITGDETWVHLFTPERNRASMQWRHDVLFACEGVMYIEFMKKGTNINADSYRATLTSLRKAIKNRSGKISSHCSPERQCNNPYGAHNKIFASTISMGRMEASAIHPRPCTMWLQSFRLAEKYGERGLPTRKF